MPGGKARLDLTLVQQGLYETRQQAQAGIMAGEVYVAGRRVDKAGTMVSTAVPLEVKASGTPYASRAGQKLEAALIHFALTPAGWHVADIGASTGGFTDCWLKHGAAVVYAVDVGRGQLISRLANDPRVIVRDRCNARNLTLAQVGDRLLDGASVDVSFIGLHLILPPLAGVVRPGGSIVALVKPQFEAGPDKLGKGGVVRDPDLHRAVLSRITAEVGNWGLGVEGLIPSPIRGGEGNREFLLWMVRGSEGQPVDVDRAVAAAWRQEGEGV